MGSFSNYSSPKASYESSYSTPSSPKYSSYESSKVSSGYSSYNSSSVSSSKSSSSKSSKNSLKSSKLKKEELNNISDLINSYLEINAKIESTTNLLEQLEEEKVNIEEKIANTPGFDKVSAMFESINDSKGAKRKL